MPVEHMIVWYVLGITLVPLSIILMNGVLDWACDVHLYDRCPDMYDPPDLKASVREAACFDVTPTRIAQILLSGIVAPMAIVVLGITVITFIFTCMAYRFSGFWSRKLFNTCGR